LAARGCSPTERVRKPSACKTRTKCAKEDQLDGGERNRLLIEHAAKERNIGEQWNSDAAAERQRRADMATNALPCPKRVGD